MLGRVTLVALLLLGLGGSVRAGEMEDKRDALLAEEWVKKADWKTDYDKVREEAKKSGKLIFAYFTRSYAF